MMTRTIHVVVGKAGAYSDAREWIVKAYAEPEHAADCISRLRAWCAEHDRFEYGQHPPDDPRFVDEHPDVYPASDVAYSIVDTTLEEPWPDPE